MSDTVLHAPTLRTYTIELRPEERRQLNAIVDLLIPSDDDFPAPSSLPLVDEFLFNLLPSNGNRTTLMINEKRLRNTLRDLNILAGGDFCSVTMEQQQHLLRCFELRDPATFQSLWSITNHSYYTLLATVRRRHRQPSRLRGH